MLAATRTYLLFDKQSSRVTVNSGTECLIHFILSLKLRNNTGLSSVQQHAALNEVLSQQRFGVSFSTMWQCRTNLLSNMYYFLIKGKKEKIWERKAIHQQSPLRVWVYQDEKWPAKTPHTSSLELASEGWDTLVLKGKRYTWEHKPICIIFKPVTWATVVRICPVLVHMQEKKIRRPQSVWTCQVSPSMPNLFVCGRKVLSLKLRARMVVSIAPKQTQIRQL